MRIPHALTVVSLVVALIASACGGSGDGATATPTAVRATPTPSAPDLTVFTGFEFPLAGGCLPESDLLMPNAPREYRGGVHEGMDLYDIDNCTEIKKLTPVLAAKAGKVIRADHEYHDLTQAELDAANARIANGEPNAFEVIDLFRGRQVWIEHDGGIITRYAHLESIQDGIVEGTEVSAGDLVAFVGDSGTPESLSNPDQEIHLHFEVRVGESFLGAGAPPEEVRAMYERLFSPLPPP